jgi:hypothetical protein
VVYYDGKLTLLNLMKLTMVMKVRIIKITVLLMSSLTVAINSSVPSPFAIILRMDFCTIINNKGFAAYEKR